MFRSMLRFAVGVLAACCLMLTLGCGDVKPDADATGDGPKSSENKDKAADGGGAAKAD